MAAILFFFAFLNGKTLQQILADRKVKLSVPKLVENICLPYSSKMPYVVKF